MKVQKDTIIILGSLASIVALVYIFREKIFGDLINSAADRAGSAAGKGAAQNAGNVVGQIIGALTGRSKPLYDPTGIDGPQKTIESPPANTRIQNVVDNPDFYESFYKTSESFLP